MKMPNATLLSRKLQNKIDKYKAPGGYEVELSGDATQTTDMLKQMGKALALGFMLADLFSNGCTVPEPFIPDLSLFSLYH